MSLLADRLPPTGLRVDRNTSPAIRQRLRDRADAEVARLEGADDAALDDRLQALQQEWDVERTLQFNAALVSSLGLLLGATVHRRFLLLPAAVFTFFGQHALQGWCPPLPLFRRLGVRTVREIERERHAIKALRGDFDNVPADGRAPTSRRVRAALAAVDA